MMQLGETLIQYPKLPTARRAELAKVIEKESMRLLERVRRTPIKGR